MPVYQSPDSQVVEVDVSQRRKFEPCVCLSWVVVFVQVTKMFVIVTATQVLKLNYLMLE